MCEICHDRTAKYICQSCGALVCEDHYSPYSFLCTGCLGVDRLSDRPIEKMHPSPKNLFTLEMIWVLGIIIIFMGFILLSGVQFDVSGGLIIFPLPFIIPINTLWGFILSVILFLLLILVFIYIMYRSISHH